MTARFELMGGVLQVTRDFSKISANKINNLREKVTKKSSVEQKIFCRKKKYHAIGTKK
jgi:hypothetical protein